MYIYKAGVVGAGLMGSGIAQVVSYGGLPVVLKDVSVPLVERGWAAARAVYEARVKKGKMTAEELDKKMALIQATTSYDDFRDVDLVVEAVPEDLELKKTVLRELHQVCPPTTIFATNTSALSVTAMAAACGRPDRMIGLHFFYPAPVMKLVEVVSALQTSAEVVDAGFLFVESLRKLPVRVKECAGFLVNRLLMPYLGEAILMVEERAATPDAVDAACVAFGMPMGPFLLADTLGVDICTHTARVMARAYGPRAAIPSLLEKLYAERKWGVKSGAGFFAHGAPHHDLNAYLPAQPRGTTFSLERMLYAMVNEAALCIDESIAAPSDIDLAMMAGTGWPQKTGGLLHWADAQGIERILERLRGWCRELGPRFWPAPYLVRLAEAGRGFFSA
jgi:3-hydroxyacyl-CoA dehydrogenase